MSYFQKPVWQTGSTFYERLPQVRLLALAIPQTGRKPVWVGSAVGYRPRSPSARHLCSLYLDRSQPTGALPPFPEVAAVFFSGSGSANAGLSNFQASSASGSNLSKSTLAAAKLLKVFAKALS